MSDEASLKSTVAVFNDAGRSAVLPMASLADPSGAVTWAVPPMHMRIIGVLASSLRHVVASRQSMRRIVNSGVSANIVFDQSRGRRRCGNFGWWRCAKCDARQCVIDMHRSSGAAPVPQAEGRVAGRLHFGDQHTLAQCVTGAAGKRVTTANFRVSPLQRVGHPDHLPVLDASTLRLYRASPRPRCGFQAAHPGRPTLHSLRCAPGCASAHARSGWTCTDRLSQASRNLISSGKRPWALSGTSPMMSCSCDFKRSRMVPPAWGPSAMTLVGTVTWKVGQFPGFADRLVGGQFFAQRRQPMAAPDLGNEDWTKHEGYIEHRESFAVVAQLRRIGIKMRSIGFLVSVMLAAGLQAEVVISMPPPPPDAAPEAIATAAVAALAGFAANTPAKDRAGGGAAAPGHPRCTGRHDGLGCWRKSLLRRWLRLWLRRVRATAVGGGDGGRGFAWGYGCLPVNFSGNGVGGIGGTSGWSSSTCGWAGTTVMPIWSGTSISIGF